MERVENQQVAHGISWANPPAAPLTVAERRWGNALLGEEVLLRAWLDRGPAVIEEHRRVGVDGPGVANAHPVVAVVVLSHNDRRTALRCLDSIDTLTYRRGGLFVVLVENSTDRSQRVRANDLRTRGYGFSVTLLRPDRNTGFAAGVNLGARYAFAGGRADHILLLNDDVLIPEGSADLVQELVALTGLLPDVAAVGPKVYFERHPAGPDVVASAGASFTELPQEVGRPDGGLHGIIESDFVVGACMLIPRSAWNAVGDFDARFFAYYEETEWCYRARLRGLKSYCVRDVHVLHGAHEQEFHKRHRDPTYTRLAARNQVLLARRHRWFGGIVAERLTRKYRQLLRLGEQQAADGMVEGVVWARRNYFPTQASNHTRISTIGVRREAPAAASPVIVVYMGRVSRQKNVELLAHLAAQGAPGLEVHIRGISNLNPNVPDDNDYLHRLYGLLRESGAFRRNSVAIYGAFDASTRESFLRRYARMDAIVVHPARFEGFGLVLLEAMEHGIPVVADLHGGLACSFKDDPYPPIDLVDFAQLGPDELLQRLLARLADRRALAQQRRRGRAYVAALPSVPQMFATYREHFLAVCAERGVTPPAVVFLSGGALYKVGGHGEWLASLGPSLRNDTTLRGSILTLPGGDREPVPRYREALRGLPWEEFRIGAHREAPSPLDRTKMNCFRELIGLFACELPPVSPRYARILHRFHRQISRQDYWAVCGQNLVDLVDCYLEFRPGMSHQAVERWLAMLLHGYLVENLLPKNMGARSCLYAEHPSVGLLAAVRREQGGVGAYVLGLHSFTDVFHDEAIARWPNVRPEEQDHFKRVIRDLFAYSVMKSDLVICVSKGLERHVRSRFADYPLPTIITIPNTLPRRSPDLRRLSQTPRAMWSMPLPTS